MARVLKFDYSAEDLIELIEANKPHWQRKTNTIHTPFPSGSNTTTAHAPVYDVNCKTEKNGLEESHDVNHSNAQGHKELSSGIYVFLLPI